VEPEETWYYLNRARQVGPYSLPELYMLLAKEVIAPTTLVWSPGRGGWREFQDVAGQPQALPSKRRRAWAAAIFGPTMFLAVLTAVERAPTESESGFLLVTAAIPKKQHESVERIRVYKPNPVFPAAVSAPAPVPYASAGRVLLPDERVELELWQASASSDEPNPYEYYLSQYPSGAFASIATAKINQLRKPVARKIDKKSAKKAPVSTSVQAIPKAIDKKPAKKQAVSTPVQAMPKTTALKAPVKPVGRCTDRNREQCRERCSAGDTLACQRMQRLGG
jgi:hypothetical protein